LSEEEEKKLSRLEKRLVANVDFDDQALNSLGFGTDIYYMLGHLGWVQFSNGVSANTHKEFALEILMMGCQVYHSDWREFSKCFPMSILGSYLVSKRELMLPCLTCLHDIPAKQSLGCPPCLSFACGLIKDVGGASHDASWCMYG
jgi:hypothetical protein